MGFERLRFVKLKRRETVREQARAYKTLVPRDLVGGSLLAIRPANRR